MSMIFVKLVLQWWEILNLIIYSFENTVFKLYQIHVLNKYISI